jgi:hypothetical protein
MVIEGSGEMKSISGGVAVPLHTDGCLAAASSSATSASSSLLCSSLDAIASPQDRHLYVNSTRYTRPSASDTIVALFADPETVAVDAVGYTLTLPTQPTQPTAEDIQATIASWGDKVEFVYTMTGSAWTESRCVSTNVTVLSSTTVRIDMATPCFVTQQNKPCGQSSVVPASIENTRVEDLQPGQFYTDLANNVITVFPTEEDAGVKEAVMPIVETLVTSTSSADLTLSNIRFEHATWARPSSELGYAEQQSGGLVSEPAYNGECDGSTWEPMESNLMFHGANGVKIDSCEFTHLGAGGVSFVDGSSSNSVTRNTFTDISGTAVQVGSYNTASLTDPKLLERDNLVQDNYISNVAVEFRGTCGVQFGYTEGSVISHNEIFDLPYSGISIGWGWGREDPSYAANNDVSYNLIHDFKLVLCDGGGIYALSAQPNSTMTNNWLYNMGKGAGGGAYYPDQASAYWALDNNVFSNSSFCEDDCEWLHIWQDSIHDIKIGTSWTDTRTKDNAGINTEDVDTVLVEDGQWPDEAVSVMNGAGVRPIRRR